MDHTAPMYQPLSFRFTEDGFFSDARRETLSPSDRALLEQFEQDRDQALYRLGLGERQSGQSPSWQFLYLLSDLFFKIRPGLCQKADGEKRHSGLGIASDCIFQNK